MNVTRLLLILLLSVSVFATTETSETSSSKVKYKKGKDVNFEELLIQGLLKRPEVSVVTGDSPDGTDGLLRLRENFLDRVAVDVGEDVP
jgi:hypothetical protein